MYSNELNVDHRKLASLDRKFRNLVSNDKQQRTFTQAHLLKIIKEYAGLMKDEIFEPDRRNAQFIIERITLEPEMTRFEALDLLSLLSIASTKKACDIILDKNMATKASCFMMLQAIDGSDEDYDIPKIQRTYFGTDQASDEPGDRLDGAAPEGSPPTTAVVENRRRSSRQRRPPPRLSYSRRGQHSCQLL
ncbi:Oidioi.mRNA.OKI2018_I69.XSR.g13745.t1.cds [Oikopleura dioica]|uniref:Oidioi.mRNA.OKI2018_I69.XSR.g13745.t1.cds n=1 Tax=Oikopleura dioica TaxID=34765 RepID=A0ABN7S7R8_OIKDI|nr:Oidioi.mRNA.OKI2018_I69.XSR.g13745.t1.cds [Oikopleura dioica]